jgi:hypothetical protein
MVIGVPEIYGKRIEAISTLLSPLNLLLLKKSFNLCEGNIKKANP